MYRVFYQKRVLSENQEYEPIYHEDFRTEKSKNDFIQLHPDYIFKNIEKIDRLSSEFKHKEELGKLK